MRYLLNPIQRPDIVKGVDARRKTSVETKYLVVDQGGQRKIVEKVGEELPNVRIAIFSKTLIIKAINLGDLSRLMVTPKNGDPLGIANFKSNKKCDCLNRVISSIDVVTFSRTISRRFNVSF